MVAELWVRGIGQRCGGSGAQARQRRTAMAMVARTTIATIGQRAEGQMAQMSEGEAAAPCLHPWACQLRWWVLATMAATLVGSDGEGAD